MKGFGDCFPWDFLLYNILLCKTNMTKFNCKLAHHKKKRNAFLLVSYLSVHNEVGNSFAASFS